MDQMIPMEKIQELVGALQGWWTANFMVSYPLVQALVVLSGFV